MTNPFDIFDPRLALDPSAFSGETGAAQLLQAAAQFPGGPALLVFALFWAPVGPGIPAGVLLAQSLRMPPPLTFALYGLSDLLAVMLLHPAYMWLRRRGRRIPVVHKIGSRFLRMATIGMRPLTAEEVKARGLGPALLRIATIGFGFDIYTAGALATGLPIPRVPAWLAALAGDLLWFAMLLGTSIGAAQVFDDQRITAIIVVAVSIFGPMLLRRLFPALR